MASTSPTLNEDLEKNAPDRDISPPFKFGDEKDERRPSVFAADRETQLRQGSVTVYHEGFFGAFKPSSFRRNPNARVVSEATDSEGRPLKDQPPAEPALAMKLKQRHLQMIAIGGSIGMANSPSLNKAKQAVVDLSQVPASLSVRARPWQQEGQRLSSWLMA